MLKKDFLPKTSLDSMLHIPEPPQTVWSPNRLQQALQYHLWRLTTKLLPTLESDITLDHTNISISYSKPPVLLISAGIFFKLVPCLYVYIGGDHFKECLCLISDSFHMFFDCTGLLAGLAASVISKWRPNERFSYGYVRAEVIAGFVNGLFLLFIAFFIMSEAVERAIEPPEVKHERLFVVSILGFLVNLVGIYAFQHGHSHGGGSSHSHSHSHSHSMENNHLPHGHSHGVHLDIDIGSSGNSQIMKGVFLHVLADTLGSVGVIISAILMHLFGWMRADPICSMFIALLIAASVLSLLKESTMILMQRQPTSLDKALPHCYQQVTGLAGVYSVQEPHFWTLCSDVYIGAVKLEVSKNIDPKYVVSQTQRIFGSIGVKQVYVQLDYSPM